MPSPTIFALRIGKYAAQIGGGTLSVKVSGKVDGYLSGALVQSRVKHRHLGNGSVTYTKDVLTGNTTQDVDGLIADPLQIQNGDLSWETLAPSKGSITMEVDKDSKMLLTGKADSGKKDSQNLKGTDGTFVVFNITTVPGAPGGTFQTSGGNKGKFTPAISNNDAFCALCNVAYEFITFGDASVDADDTLAYSDVESLSTDGTRANKCLQGLDDTGLPGCACGASNQGLNGTPVQANGQCTWYDGTNVTGGGA